MATLQRLTLEEPGVLVATLAIAGLVLLVLGNQRASRRLMKVGLIIAAAGLLLWLTATLVVTSRERLQERTRALLAATAPLEVAALREIFHPTAVLTARGTPVTLPLEPMLVLLESRLLQFRVSEHRIEVLDAQVRGDDGETLLKIATTMDAGGWSGPIRSMWRIRWRWEEATDPPTWRIIAVEMLELQGQDPPPDVIR